MNELQYIQLNQIRLQCHTLDKMLILFMGLFEWQQAQINLPIRTV